MNTVVRNLYHSVPFVRKLNIMRVQFLLCLDRERKHLFTVEAVDVPCPLCGNEERFTPVFRPFLVSKLRVVRCEGCGLRFQRPMPTARFFEWMYGNKYLKRVKRSGYERADSHTQRSYDAYFEHADDVVRFLKPHLPAREAPVVLEVGPAHGCNLEAFRKLDSNVVLYEDELDRRWEAQYREKRILNWHQRPPGTLADIIVLSAVLEHFRDPVAELERLRELLVDDGVMYIEVPNVPEDLEYFSGYKLAHTFYFSEESLRTTLERVGLRQLATEAGQDRLLTACRKQ